MATSHFIAVFADSTGTPITGRAELWVSEPIVNGMNQSAPPFHETAELTPGQGVAVFLDLPQRAEGENWYYVLMVYPATHDCSKEGAMQFRFYIPEGATPIVNLTYLIANYSAW